MSHPFHISGASHADLPVPAAIFSFPLLGDVLLTCTHAPIPEDGPRPVFLVHEREGRS